jgi:hypothetical protein
LSFADKQAYNIILSKMTFSNNLEIQDAESYAAKLINQGHFSANQGVKEMHKNFNSDEILVDITKLMDHTKLKKEIKDLDNYIDLLDSTENIKNPFNNENE